jgi:hypothetical protein
VQSHHDQAGIPHLRQLHDLFRRLAAHHEPLDGHRRSCRPRQLREVLLRVMPPRRIRARYELANARRHEDRFDHVRQDQRHAQRVRDSARNGDLSWRRSVSTPLEVSSGLGHAKLTIELHASSPGPSRASGRPGNVRAIRETNG